MIQTTPTARVPSLSGDAFLCRYKARHEPVIIENLTRPWPARAKWSMDYLRAVAGDKIVPLYDSRPARGHSHQHAPSARMPLKDYIDLLKAGERDLRMFFYNLLSEAPQLTRDFSYPDIGLRFFKRLPVLFFAGKGARVQMHFDIDLADLLLCHFGGPKQVYLFPPEQTRFMYRVPFSFSSLFAVDFESPDFTRFPALRRLRGQVADLKHGDALYIPPGYWHHVIYRDIGFSMTLRAFPRQPRQLTQMIYNLAVLRTADGLMRRLIGDAWNVRNERLAVERTHRRLTRCARTP